MSTTRAADFPRTPLAWLALLALPIVGLAVLIARPSSTWSGVTSRATSGWS